MILMIWSQISRLSTGFLSMTNRVERFRFGR
jgi:hypothetical protein